MNLRPPPYIDLTGHLGSLKSSLTPACKHFEPMPPLWQLAPRPDAEAQTTIIRLGIAFLIIFSATIAAAVACSQ